MSELIKVTIRTPIRLAFFVVCSMFAASTLCAQSARPDNPKIKGLSWNFYQPVQLPFIDSLRNQIKGSATSPDEFLYGSFSSQLDLTPLDIHSTDTLLRYVMTAEACKNARNYLQPEQAILFEAMGDKMLSKLADTLQAGIELKTFDPTNSDIAYLIRRLADNHYLINIKISNAQKTLGYLREGRFGYVFHKLTTTYKAEFMKFLGVLTLLALLFFFRKRIARFIKNALSSKK